MSERANFVLSLSATLTCSRIAGPREDGVDTAVLPALVPPARANSPRHAATSAILVALVRVGLPAQALTSDHLITFGKPWSQAQLATYFFEVRNRAEYIPRLKRLRGAYLVVSPSVPFSDSSYDRDMYSYLFANTSRIGSLRVPEHVPDALPNSYRTRNFDVLGMYGPGAKA